MPPSDHVESPHSSALPTEGIELLIIEDDPASAVMLREQLAMDTSSPVRETVVSRLADALALIEEQSFDVALLDLNLPDSQGIATFERLRHAAPELPLVVNTGLELRELVRRVLRGGAQDYLRKGYLPERGLTRILHDAIARHRFIAEIHRQARACAESEDRVRSIIETSADAVVIIAADGTVQFANPAATLLFDRDVPGLLGESFGFPLVADDTVEIDILRRDGQLCVAEMRVVALDWVGEPALLASLRDVTERREREQQLARRNRDLTRLLGDADDALEHARQDLQNLSHAVSHDLRPTLRVLDSFLEMLKLRYGEKFDDEGGVFLRRAQDVAGRRLRAVVGNLLRLASVARAEMHHQPMMLDEVARDVAIALCRQHPQRNVHFSCPDRLKVVGDLRMLRIVLEILMGNAWQFTALREHAKVELAYSEARDGVPVLCLSDDGCGMNADEAARLFEVTPQMAATTPYVGMGMGLATVSHIIHRHGGRIWAESTLHRGTAFFFTLPGHTTGGGNG